jgi:hypothetical protein
MYGCRMPAEATVSSPTSDRLHERWECCMPHVPRVIAYLRKRDAAWALPSDRIVVQQLARGRG